MKNLSFFCLTLNPEHEKSIKEFGYIPVGLGDKRFSRDILSDKLGENISKKNPYFGEYTFHYWIWKNYLKEIKTEWVGFCQYRKFFFKDNVKLDNIKKEDLKNLLIDKIELNDQKYDCILGTKFSVIEYKISKIIKHHLFEFLSKPSLLFDKRKRTLKFHFDLFHGRGNLDKAINLLDEKYKKDFKNYMDKETSFHPHNMFICKTKILHKYYEAIFPWLEKCEKEFGFKDLEGYGKKRIYGFLAERFLSFWFSKKFTIREKPIIVKNISEF